MMRGRYGHGSYTLQLPRNGWVTLLALLAAGAAADVVLALIVALVCSAMVEAYRQLADIRASLHLEDLPRPMALRPGELRASDLGLPARLAEEPEAIAIFMTTTCATCLMVAEMFRGGAPATVWFVLPGRDSDLATTLAASSARFVLDEDGSIAERAGLNVAPSVLTLRFGEVVRAHAVSTPRQVLSLVPAVMPRTGEIPLTDEANMAGLVGRPSKVPAQ